MYSWNWDSFLWMPCLQWWDVWWFLSTLIKNQSWWIRHKKWNTSFHCYFYIQTTIAAWQGWKKLMKYHLWMNGKTKDLYKPVQIKISRRKKFFVRLVYLKGRKVLRTLDLCKEVVDLVVYDFLHFILFYCPMLTPFSLLRKLCRWDSITKIDGQKLWHTREFIQNNPKEEFDNHFLSIKLQTVTQIG